MSELTIKEPGGYTSINPVDIMPNEYSEINFERIVNKLGEYEYLEKAENILKLPCRVGDVLHMLSLKSQKIKDCKVTGFMFNGLKLHILTDYITFSPEDFNQKVFIDKEKAKAKLTESEEKTNVE